MGWLVLSVLGALLAIQLVVLMRIRVRKPTPPKATMEISSPQPPDNSTLGF